MLRNCYVNGTRALLDLFKASVDVFLAFDSTFLADHQEVKSMAVPQSVVDELMAKCARHCCICRRFRPLHLIVHHIVERNDGGTDEPGNLIVI